MLPSFRLFAATFCCGFLVVFAGLRLAATFNSVNQALPVMAAHAAPIRIAALTEQDRQRLGAAIVPVTYDLRFAVSAAQPAPIAPAPAIDRTPPLLMPLVILPPIAQDTTEPAEEPTTVAALPSQPATETAPATIDIPLPEPATIDLTFSPSPANTRDKPSVAVAAVAAPVQATTSIDIPLPEPANVDLTFSPTPAPAEPEVEIGPKSEAAPSAKPETDARAASAHEHDAEPITVAALVGEIPLGTVKLPVRHIPLPKPKAVSKPVQRTAALQPTAARRATRHVAAKAKPRRHAVAKGDDFESLFNFQTGQN
ncbi:hypothetical protein [Rhodoplanes sp. Z2-YC6860]|uniref:hypothetical protein n=1 Tax=Rhodoplanes sp. Z2-YC6860 TaxID=674703 RepID=UPI0008350217|nr:hypothetical protein [Rhodoplanes sp. Z2-YC6860]